jgi:hypothetical protein
LNKQPLGDQNQGREIREDMQNTTGQHGHRYNNVLIAEQNNGKRFIMGCASLLETSVCDNESFYTDTFIL